MGNEVIMYERPDSGSPNKPHSIIESFSYLKELKFKKIDGFIYDKIEPLYNDAETSLSALRETCRRIEQTNWSDFKPEVAKQKKAEMILKSRRNLMTTFAKHLHEAETGMKTVQSRIMAITEPEDLAGMPAGKAIAIGLREREIRDRLLATDPKERRNLIRGNKSFLQACVNSPIPILKKEVLDEFRREYAFDYDPSAKLLEEDSKSIYQAIRKEAAAVNASAVRMLLMYKVEDPLPADEHFKVFTPSKEHEAVIAEEKSLNSVKRKIKFETERKFLSEQEKLNQEREQRRERMMG
jgi:hypothetical protein